MIGNFVVVIGFLVLILGVTSRSLWGTWLASVVLALILILNTGAAFAHDWRGVPFPVWPRITVAQILKPSPEVSSTAGYGSVTKEYRTMREVVGCPIEVDGRVVGWSLACKTEGK